MAESRFGALESPPHADNGPRRRTRLSLVVAERAMSDILFSSSEDSDPPTHGARRVITNRLNTIPAWAMGTAARFRDCWLFAAPRRPSIRGIRPT